MTGAVPAGGALLVEDETSFAEPRRQAIANAIQAFKDASKQVRGSEARVRAALDDLEALDGFVARIGELLEKRGFQDLPGLIQEGKRLRGFHHLTVGPWRGVFLISNDGGKVIALVFSKVPHALEARLDEIAGRHAAESDDEAAS